MQRCEPSFLNVFIDDVLNEVKMKISERGLNLVDGIES